MKVGDFEFNEKSWTVEIKATLSLQEGLSQSPTEDTSVRGTTSRKRQGSIFLRRPEIFYLGYNEFGKRIDNIVVNPSKSVENY